MKMENFFHIQPENPSNIFDLIKPTNKFPFPINNDGPILWIFRWKNCFNLNLKSWLSKSYLSPKHLMNSRKYFDIKRDDSQREFREGSREKKNKSGQNLP